jgi:hypothetical protein
LLIEGLVARHKDLSGGQRQITEIHVPGISSISMAIC